MNKKIVTASILVCCSITGTAQAALQGRDLNGSIDSFEAYYDTDLNITWLADANYGAGSSYDNNLPWDSRTGSTTDGRMTWVNAKAWAANLSFTDGVNTYTDWRLPTSLSKNASEMWHLFYNELGGVSGRVITTTHNANYSLFSNVQPSLYWTSTEYAASTYSAFMFSMINGERGPHDKTSFLYAWAVSDGDVGITAIPEPSTYAMMLVGLGLVGFMAQRGKHTRIQHQQERGID